jgi:predicted Ser/Thr protein kinase
MDREPKPIAETIAETAILPASNGGSAPSGISQFTSSSSSCDDEGRFLPGTLLGGRYRIVGLLGRGGMGEVYRAMDLALGQAVALKFLPEEAARNPRLLERFHGEVRVARLVSHPNVCRVFDIGEIDGTPFISMEYVDGEDLASLLTRIGRLPADKALQAARQLCAGLAAAHDRGVIHRDLKPQNVMMNKRGDLVIMDFGLAAIADQLSGAEVRNGTPAYMAPEQLRGAAVTSASDIYALGLVLYELFTGKRPYEAKTLQTLIDLQESGHLASMTSIASDVDPMVEKVIRRCLDADPLKRPAGPIAVAAALPGGDPLAAALAAGETPSPELVANAGKVEGLALRYSIPCLAVIVASVVFACVLHANHRAQMMDPAAAPPDVLAHAARQISASFGYTERPADSVVWVENRGDLVDYLQRQPGPKQWAAWFASEAPMRAYYREAPIPLIAKPDGSVAYLNPPMAVRGMTFVDVDGHGRLLGFSAVPRDRQGSATPEDVFRAARLDIATFHEVTPKLIPAHASDTIRAWEGTHPDIAGMNLTVQVASWRGQITQAAILYPWMRTTSAAEAPAPLLTRIREAAVLVLPILGALFAALVARRNWKLGRTDRRGALRVAGARLLLGLVTWVGTMHPVPTGDMLELFSNSAAVYLLWSVLMWVVYLAVEPAIRARYPHAMITWNRLLAGRWLDAQVCAHVLIGATLGCLLWCGVEWIETSGVHSGGNTFVLLGTRQWIARHAIGAATGLNYGLLLFAVICFLRRLVRYDILAALAAGALFAMNESDVAQASNWQMMAAIFVVVFAILAFVLIRFGLVASISAIYFANCFPNIWIGGDWKAWYVPIGIASTLFMLALAGVAFWKSLGNRDLLGET